MFTFKIMISILALSLFSACSKKEIAKENSLQFFATGVKQETKTKLLWQDQSINKNNEQSWLKANLYCENLTIGKLNAWRLPTKEELISLVRVKKDLEEMALFYYWSSTRFTSKRDSAYFSYFGEGCLRNNASMHKEYLVRCVHNP